MRAGARPSNIVVMSPDDVAAVQRSWAELRPQGPRLLAQLTWTFVPHVPTGTAPARAGWLLDAVHALVDLLETPSRLGPAARDVVATWPAPGQVPSAHVEGEVWLAAARVLCPTWTAATDSAWRSAWLMLSDVLAQESLSPFAGPIAGDSA